MVMIILLLFVATVIRILGICINICFFNDLDIC